MTWSGATAQLAGKGQINGTVTDTSGAAIPGAQIVVKSKQTSLSTNATTTSAGDFSLPTLDPGDYTVTITANGFEKLVQENVHVNALETQTLSPKLTVGATSEQVTGKCRTSPTGNEQCDPRLNHGAGDLLRPPH